MAKYKAYPEYKDSGVEWLGDIPKNWDLKKLKYLSSIQTGNKDTVDAIEDGIYPFFVRSQIIEKINSIGANCEAVLTAGDGAGVGKIFFWAPLGPGNLFFVLYLKLWILSLPIHMMISPGT